MVFLRIKVSTLDILFINQDMKLILTLLFLLFLAPVVFAQVDSNKILYLAPPKFVEVSNNVKKQTTVRICCGAIADAPALVVIFSHDKIIYKSASGPYILDKIPRQSIKSVNVFKDSLSVAKYGALAKGGVIEIYIDDKNYPDVYKIFKTDPAEIEKASKIKDQ